MAAAAIAVFSFLMSMNGLRPMLGSIVDIRKNLFQATACPGEVLGLEPVGG